MFKKIGKGFLILSGLVFIILISLYLVLAFYYRNGFSYNTWINGVYCTGKSVSEVNSELKNKYEKRTIEIINPDNTKEYINPEDIDFNIDFTEFLSGVKNNQNSFMWILNLSNWKKGAVISPEISFDSQKLEDCINNLSFVKEYLADKPQEVEIILSDKGYELFDSTSPKINLSMVTEKVIYSLYNDDPLRFDESFLFEKFYSKEQNQILLEWDRYKSFFDTRIIYDMGTELVPIDRKILSGFVSLNDDGTFYKNSDGEIILSKEKIDDFVDEFLSKYDTYDKPRMFRAHDGAVKEIKNVYYGTLLDHDAEKKYLYEALTNGTDEMHTPKYIKQGYVRGLDDIGPNYIEVDMGIQKLFYYEDYSPVLVTDIVSGRPGYDATPQMICFVYGKKKDAILRGTNYASPVDYWMPIYKGIGLHDASWQSKFGGDRYKTHGSHGCINMQDQDVKYLFETIDIGIPVILYY